MRDPIDRWEPWPVEVHLTGGPERVYDDKPELTHAPVGFTADIEPRETEPLLWDGDNA